MMTKGTLWGCQKLEARVHLTAVGFSMRCTGSLKWSQSQSLPLFHNGKHNKTIYKLLPRRQRMYYRASSYVIVRGN
jgi:shikimate kinase